MSEIQILRLLVSGRTQLRAWWQLILSAGRGAIIPKPDHPSLHNSAQFIHRMAVCSANIPDSSHLKRAVAQAIGSVPDAGVDFVEVFRCRAIRRHHVDRIAERSQQQISVFKEHPKFRTDAREVAAIARFQIERCNGSGATDVCKTGVSAEWRDRPLLHRGDRRNALAGLLMLSELQVTLCSGACDWIRRI